MARRRLGILDWPGFLSDFHSAHPGAVEEVLSRAKSGRHNPYRWLSRAVGNVSGRVLDVACGAGAMSRQLAADGRMIIGLDVAASEVQLAAQRSSGPWVQADALRLPLADESIDAVVSCMGFAVVQPVGDLLDEVYRVLRPGGLLAVIAPSLRPMNGADLRMAGQLFTTLRMRPQFPGSLERTGFTAMFEERGLRTVEDARERYHYTVYDRSDAERFFDALYLPGGRASRKQAAIDLLARRASRQGSCDIPVPMRRLVALK